MRPPTSPLRQPASAANHPRTSPLRCPCGVPRPGRADSDGHCHRCHASWRGVRAAHCATCHATFTSASAFDVHQDGVEPVRCRNPAAVGLVQRQDGVWRMARGDEHGEAEEPKAA